MSAGLADAVPRSVTSYSVVEPTAPRYVRSPVTVVRLALLLFAALVLIVPLGRISQPHFTTRFGNLLEAQPRWLVSGSVTALQLGFLMPALLGLLSLLARRRFLRVGRMLLAAIVGVAGLLLLSRVLGNSVIQLVPGRSPNGGPPVAGVGPRPAHLGVGPPFPTVLDLAILLAAYYLDASQWPSRWQRFGRIILVVGVVAHMGISLTHPVVILAVLVVAGAAAQVVQLAFGSPNRQISGHDVGDALQSLGHSVRSVARADDGFRGFDGFTVERVGAGRLYAKVVSRDSWITLLPTGIYRALRFREGGDHGPFRSLRATVEHEALCALKAYADHIPTPRLVSVSELRSGAMLIAFESPAVVRLSDLAPAERPPHMLDAVWSITAGLHRNHMVHHHLNLESLVIDNQGTVSLIEFGATTLGVTGAELATDIAEVLAGTASRLGVEQAVAAAVNAVGTEAVAACLPRLQTLALTRRTRTMLKEVDCLPALRDEVRRVTGAAEVPMAHLERIRPRSIATAAMSALALWTMIPQLVGFSGVWDRLGDANWGWLAAGLALSVITYLGAAVALDGSVGERLPMVPNLGVQAATSFIGIAAPGGSLPLTIRFLQRRGIESAAAAAAIGVKLAAGIVVHVILTGLFLAFSGTSGLKTFHLPSLAVLAAVFLGIVVLGGIALALGRTRAMLTNRLVPAVKRSIASASEVAHRPSKVVELFGGSLAITLGYLLTLEVTVVAFGGGPAFTSVALVYLLGSVVIALAPTPGGIGAVEATLIAGLTSAGMPSTTAVAAVMVFRLVTFWLPLLPGWAALNLLQRAGDL